MGLGQGRLGGGGSPVVMYGDGGPCGVALVVLVGRLMSWRVAGVSVGAVVA